MASVDHSDSESDSNSESEGSDFDQDDEYSDRSFSSDTESEDDSQSSMESLDSSISNVHEDLFWTDDLHDVEIGQFDERVGPNHHLAPDAPVLQFFFLMFSQSFFLNIADQTNIYARQQTSQHPDSAWYETTALEMMAFLGLHILMGIVQLPRLKMYWSNNKFFGNKGFQDTMTIRRFYHLQKYFHINDNNTQGQPETPNYDRLHKVRPIIEMARRNFKHNMKPSKQQTVDEGMIKYKGHHYARMYMPDKPVKRGLKVWMRCGPDGYCHDFRPYLGKHDIFRGRGLGERVVTHLCRDLKWKSHHVFFDRYFTSIRLLRTLEQNGVYACGTISKTAEGFPEELRNPGGLEWGDCMQLQHENLVATVWNDKKMVHVVSTTSNPVGDGPVIRKTRGGGVAEIMRPPPLEDYHKYMSGVDRNMQHRAKNPVGRPAKKYWKFLVNFILEECIINSFLIWKRTEGVIKPRAGYTLLDFRSDVAIALINDFSSRKISKSVPKSVTPAVPLDRHQCVKLNRKRSTCKLCTKHGQKKRKETIFGCSACSVHLCRGLCFQMYHDQFK